MAVRAAAFVGRYGNTEVIDQVNFAVLVAFETRDVGRSAFPLEVRIIQQVFANQAVAVQAGPRALVVVVGEIPNVQLGGFVGIAREGVAVEHVDVTVTVEVFLRVPNTVLVEVPAADAVGTVGTVNAGSAILSVLAVVAIASSYCECQKDHAKKGRKPKFSATWISHFCVLRLVNQLRMIAI